MCRLILQRFDGLNEVLSYGIDWLRAIDDDQGLALLEYVDQGCRGAVKILESNG